MREEYQPLVNATAVAGILGVVIGFGLYGAGTLSRAWLMRLPLILGVLAGLGVPWVAERISGLCGSALWIPTLVALAVAGVVCLALAAYVDGGLPGGSALFPAIACVGFLVGAVGGIKASDW